MFCVYVFLEHCSAFLSLMSEFSNNIVFLNIRKTASGNFNCPTHKLVNSFQHYLEETNLIMDWMCFSGHPKPSVVTG